MLRFLRFGVVSVCLSVVFVGLVFSGSGFGMELPHEVSVRQFKQKPKQERQGFFVRELDNEERAHIVSHWPSLSEAAKVLEWLDDDMDLQDVWENFISPERQLALHKYLPNGLKQRMVGYLQQIGGGSSKQQPFSLPVKVTSRLLKALKLPELQPGHIITVAGSGSAGFGGDNGLATSAQLYSPFGVFVSLDGDVFIADRNNHRVRRVSPGGVISTVAGDGTEGFGGDNGLATSAQLNSPLGVFVSLDGDVFIADRNNHRVRRVSPGGVISTVAGSGTKGFGGDNGPATSAQLNSPVGVFVSLDGDVFIADRNNHRVRRVSPQGVISTVAGSGTKGFGGDNGPATSAQLNYPDGVFVSLDGHIYIAEYGNHRVRRVSPGGVISTVAGSGSAGFGGDNGLATGAQLYSPVGVFVSLDGHVFIADWGNHRVRRVSPQGVISTVAGSGTDGFGGDNGLATSAQLNLPSGVFVSLDGHLYIADSGNHRIRVVNLNEN